jgi:hypothetical protein
MSLHTPDEQAAFDQEYSQGYNEAVKLFAAIRQLVETAMAGKNPAYCDGIRDCINDNIDEVTHIAQYPVQD